MTTNMNELNSAIAARDALRPRSAAIAEEHQRHTDAIVDCDAEIAAADGTSPDDDTAVTTWLDAGAKGPAPTADPKARAERHRRAEIASERRRGHVAAKDRLERQNAEVASAYAEAQGKVDVATAKLVGAMALEHAIRSMARLDDVVVDEHVAAILHKTMFAADGPTAAAATAAIEAARLAWLDKRGKAIEQALAERWAAISASIPA